MVAVLADESVAWAHDVRRALADAGLSAEPDEYQVVVVEHALDASPRLPATGSEERRTIVVAGAEDPEPAGVWRLLEQGAADVLAWEGPGTCDEVVQRIRRWRTIDDALRRPTVAGEMIGTSRALRSALRELVALSLYGSAPILLVGETGTGKELASRVVHALSGAGSSRPLVVVDCTTIVPTLSGSELFGHERGAYTGADRSRNGAFAAADGGTLFLDEVAELPLPLQAELLRVIQEGVYKRVGGDIWNRTRFRLVSATNRDLDKEQRKGRFRTDLYHRIASSVVRLPSLRERPEDLETLFRHFLAAALGTPSPPPVSAAVLTMLRGREFPGNVRELRQLAVRIAGRHVGGGPITPGDVPDADRPRTGPGAAQPTRAVASLELAIRDCLSAGTGLRELRSLVGDLAVDVALAEAGGNAGPAARRLGVSDRAVQMRKRGARLAPEQA
ncbi:Sigma-54 interaction domain-containing protein [Friedmanniella luteola]|uniref:Sigma-54 interaction domain-containing protein n=1 Tax=Friedmanniella luteola TaxID=546871 RepID=A0A1H1WBI2_9ACTN|nr:sigma 54-interacting transcriptional regulator [Friedmanniella luteola]SDS94444.1 Sigma-54 interaction domain-containing protein [Friedmanniella luteola]